MTINTDQDFINEFCEPQTIVITEAIKQKYEKRLEELVRSRNIPLYDYPLEEIMEIFTITALDLGNWNPN